MKVFILVDRIITKEGQEAVFPEVIPVDRIAGVRAYVSKPDQPTMDWTFIRLNGNGSERDGDTYTVLIDEKFEDFVKRLGKKPNVEIIN